MVSYEGVSLGHVAYVEAVNVDGSFVVSEMNFNGGWGRVSSRTVVPGTIYIVGFIY
jgi:surface antigen